LGLSKGRATGYKIERGMQKDKAQRNKYKKKQKHTKFKYSVKELAAIIRFILSTTVRRPTPYH